MEYKYDLHVHSSECSACAANTAKEMVHAYKNAGFSGLVLTNHFIFGNTSVSRFLPWHSRMEQYYDAYLSAKSEGDMLDFDVMFGLEHHYIGGKELLFYGIDLDFLLANDDIPTIPVYELVNRIHAYGGYVAQSHPFRARGYIRNDIAPDPSLMDAVEVFNYYNSDEENKQACDFALAHNFVRISGGDTHTASCDGIGKAGMIFSHRIRSSQDLINSLKTGEGKLIKGL